MSEAPDMIVATQYDGNGLAIREAKLRPYPQKPFY